ncbi:hypothetical protein CKY51_05735 [Xanthomonas maliensis]|nr:hypothetical protein CKY51_05735 [Xanthomonas maliensis]
MAADLRQSYGYAEFGPGKPLNGTALCAKAPFKVTLEGDRIRLASKAGAVTLADELDGGQPEVVAGDFWGNGRCFVAIKVAESDVNTSYVAYEVSTVAAPVKVASLPTLIDPDFKDGVVISSYRDAARWHQEVLCLAATGTPYLCEKRDALDDRIERVSRCVPDGTCSAARLMDSASGQAVAASVIVPKAVVFQPSTGEGMTRQRSYLVRGDRLTLTDFKTIDGQLYYRFEYRGKQITRGWIDARTVRYATPSTASP